MDKFIELWRESSVIQGLIALAVTLTVCWMYIAGREIPTELSAILFAILGFYFGAKSAIQTRQTVNHVADVIATKQKDCD